MCIVDQDTQNFNLLKAPPFSSYPSQAQIHLDGVFHCYAGCAMESLAIGIPGAPLTPLDHGTDGLEPPRNAPLGR